MGLPNFRSFEDHFSRRFLLAAGVLIPFITRADRGNAQTPRAVLPVPLDGGLWVWDYRLFPTSDAQRFIVEVHNATDQAVDAPAIGVVWNHLPQDQNYGFAVPTLDVLQPHTSSLLIGVAPDGLLDDSDWGTPAWVLCNPIQRRRTDELKQLNLSLTYERLNYEADSIYVEAFITNVGDEATNNYRLGCQVSDKFNRLCGIAPAMESYWLESGEVLNYMVEIRRDKYFTGSPFVLVDSAQDMKVKLSIQPRFVYRATECPAIMPWNR